MSADLMHRIVFFFNQPDCKQPLIKVHLHSDLTNRYCVIPSVTKEQQQLLALIYRYYCPLYHSSAFRNEGHRLYSIQTAGPVLVEEHLVNQAWRVSQ